MAPITLPAGTAVKHGTTHRDLPSILSHGLLAGHGRSPLRDETENAPVIPNGTYVGRLPAYFGALLSFSASMREGFERAPSQALAPPGIVPVVLHIKLPEDVEILADEDFIPSQAPSEDLLRSQAMAIWDHFGSAVLIREGGIPAEWITHFEFPFLTTAAKPPRAYHEDLQCLQAAHVQNSLIQTELETVLQFRRKPHKSGDHFAFSQRCPFSATGLAQLSSEAVFSNPSSLSQFAFGLWQAITVFGASNQLATRF